MKIITATFAALLLVGASSAALAQDRDHDRTSDRGQGQPHAQAPQGQQGPQGGHARPGPAAAPPAAAAPSGRGFERQGGQDHDRGGQRFQGQAPGTPAPAPGQQRSDRGQGPGSSGGRQFDHERGPREVTPPGADRGPGDRGVGRGGPDRGGPDRGGPGRGPTDRGSDRGFDNRRDGDHRAGSSPWRGGEHWQPGRAPPVFWAQNRFRIGGYRPPYGYYVRSWGFGDILPRGWYGQNYYLNDFLNYDLPYPPPGYEWVRVGGDALMVDRYSGRIVQVVRGIFW